MAKRNFGGYSGGMNRNNMMRQMQKLQKEMEEAQAKVRATVLEASAGGGMVKVTMNGDRELLSVEINPDALDPDDVEMLQDMIMVAVNDVLKQAGNLNENEMGKLTGGLSIPGL